MAIPIQEWLRGIDLERYEINFLHGGYETVHQCLDLTESDLVTLDITSSGHIKVLLANLNFLKKLNSSPQKPMAKVRQIKETKEGKEETTEITYTNVDFDCSYDCPKLNRNSSLDENDQLYTNVDFDPPPEDGSVCPNDKSASLQKKKPVPAPRIKSICEQQQMALADMNAYDEVARCPGISTPSKTKCDNDPFVPKSRIDRSTSLPTNSIFGSDAPLSVPRSGDNSIPKKIVLDLPPDPKPSTYVNVVRPFKKSETENILMEESGNAESGLTEYENYSFSERGTLPKLNKKIDSVATNLNLSKTFPPLESHAPPSGELNLSHFKPVRVGPIFNTTDIFHHDVHEALDPFSAVPSRGSLQQDRSPRAHSNYHILEMDFSHLENLSNESLENKALDLLDESSDSLPSRQSLPPPPYPPPLLVRSSAEAEGILYPMLPPRPGSKKKFDRGGESKDKDSLHLMQPLVPLTPPDLPKHSPTSPKESRPLPSIPSQDSQKDPPLLKPRESSVPTAANQKLPQNEEDLYSLETSPKYDDVPQAATGRQPSRQAPKHPKKVETFNKMESPLTKQGEVRWFVLDRDNLCCYNNEKQMTLMETIPVRKIASLLSISDNKCELSFEVLLKSSNSTLVLTADNLKWKYDWLVKIARLIACVCEEDLIRITSFERAGNVHMKLLSDWSLKWIHLSGKSLFIYLEDDCFHEIDLRKSHTIRTLPSSSGSKMVTEDSQPIQIENPEMKLCFQGWTKLDTTCWLKNIHNAINLLDPSNLYDHHMTPFDIPVIVDKCITFVANSGLEVEGIYRVSGQNSKVTKLLEMLNADARSMVIRPEEFQIHDVSSCLKRFFRQLSEPLFTRKFYSCWIEALSTNKDMQKRLASYKNLLRNLPKINYATIKFTMTHLVEIIGESDTNKMDSVNLASIFGPIFVSAEQGEMTTAGYQSTNHEINVVKDFLDNHEFLFDIKEKDRQIERTMREARKKIELLNQAGLPDAEQDLQMRGMLVSISIENDNSKSTEKDVITIQVSPAMTASDLEGPIREKLGRRDYTDWRLFEVVCDGELERLIGHDENILSLLLKYKDWPQEFCTDNSILYKKTDLLSNLRLCLEPKMFLWEDLRFATKKSFKKCYFEFTRCNLSYRKDPKASVLDSWRIEDLVIYSGIQKKRSPPTQFGITFYPVSLQLTGNLLGFSICFRSPGEMYKWLAVLLNAQQPNGLFTNKRKPHPVSASESCPDLPGKASPRPLPATIAEDLRDDMNQMSQQWDVKYEEAGFATLTSSSSSSSSTSSRTASTVRLHPSRPLPRLPAEGASGPALLTTTTSCSNINEPQARVSAVAKFFTKFNWGKEKTKE